jgi:hypothetical protein
LKSTMIMDTSGRTSSSHLCATAPNASLQKDNH